jgi:hypothetical protein
MASFKSLYRAIFATFGHPLSERTGLSSELLTAAEKRLGVQIPAALRDYYRVAGRERRFNTCHNRLLPPRDWSLDRQRLMFMEENQGAVLWSISTRNPESVDPRVFQGINEEDEPITWAREHRRCSEFLAVMLHWQAVSGGFRFLGSAASPDDVHRALKKGWNHVGEINQVWAFNRQNQVVCISASSLPFLPPMMLHAGGKTRRDLQSIEQSLSVTLA